jgi:hypothetical protein
MYLSHLLHLVFSAVLFAAAPGCASVPPRAAEDTVTVEGMVTARGNAPFSVYLLETDTGNAYVLVLDDTTRAGFGTPARLRVTGAVYRGDWQGTPFAHLRVHTWARVEEGQERP